MRPQGFDLCPQKLDPCFDRFQQMKISAGRRVPGDERIVSFRHNLRIAYPLDENKSRFVQETKEILWYAMDHAEVAELAYALASEASGLSP